LENVTFFHLPKRFMRHAMPVRQRQLKVKLDGIACLKAVIQCLGKPPRLPHCYRLQLPADFRLSYAIRAQNLNLKLTPGINKSNAWKKGGKARTGTSQKVQTQEIMVYFSKDFHPSDRTFPTADKWQSTCFSRPAIFHPLHPPKKIIIFLKI